MRLEISPRAEKQLKKLSKVDQIAVAKKIRQLGSDVGVVSKKLTGVNGYRVRVGDLRVIYTKTRDLIYIVLIDHRREAYKEMKRLLG